MYIKNLCFSQPNFLLSTCTCCLKCIFSFINSLVVSLIQPFSSNFYIYKTTYEALDNS